VRALAIIPIFNDWTSVAELVTRLDQVALTSALNHSSPPDRYRDRRQADVCRQRHSRIRRVCSDGRLAATRWPPVFNVAFRWAD